MKALLKRPRGKRAIALVALLVVVAVVIIGAVICLTTRHDSSAPKPKDVAVTFDVSTLALIGPNCSYPTPLGCFIPTDSQLKTLNDINRQGYNMAHITGKGYSDYEKVPGTVPHAPAKTTKALHVTDISSAKATGQKR